MASTDRQRHRGLAAAGMLAAALGLALPVAPCLAESAATPSKVELELQRDADDVEKRIATGGMLYGDAALDAYVQSIVSSLEEPGVPGSIRIRVIKAPLPNAFVLPNGAAYVNTALLAMVDNEAQLACVLGHEMTHFLHKHALEEFRAGKTRQSWTNALAILLGAAGAYYGGGQVGQAVANLTVGAGQLWTLAAVRGYSQDNEREADRDGFNRLVARGYDGAEAPKVFELLEASTPDDSPGERPYFSSHPRLTERIASMKLLAAEAGAGSGGRVEAERFFAALGELPLDQAMFLLEGDEHDSARAAVDRYLARRPDSARAHFVSGEIWRAAHDTPGSVDRALAEYEAAASLPDTPAAALRNKGLLHRERGEAAAARDAFTRYLSVAPQAIDAGLIRLYLAELEAPPAP
jgi:Zn-dependent protease with chaperone function